MRGNQGRRCLVSGKHLALNAFRWEVDFGVCRTLRHWKRFSWMDGDLNYELSRR